MRIVLLVCSFFVLAACVTDQRDSFWASTSACGGGQGMAWPSSDFYKDASIKDINRFYGCMKKQPLDNDGRMAMNMQESLWRQVKAKKISPDQAQEKYTMFYQNITAHQEQMAEMHRSNNIAADAIWANSMNASQPRITHCSGGMGSATCTSW